MIYFQKAGKIGISYSPGQLHEQINIFLVPVEGLLSVMVYI